MRKAKDILEDVKGRLNACGIGYDRALDLLFQEIADADADKAGKIKSLVKVVDEICVDVRERSGKDYVCGLCEYDGCTYIGAEGDYCGECPGFETDECFKMKEDFKNRYLGEDRAACEWKQMSEDSGAWRTDCGNIFWIESGTPEENKMVYCPYCGEEIKGVSYEDEQKRLYDDAEPVQGGEEVRSRTVRPVLPFDL